MSYLAERSGGDYPTVEGLTWHTERFDTFGSKVKYAVNL